MSLSNGHHFLLMIEDHFYEHSKGCSSFVEAQELLFLQKSIAFSCLCGRKIGLTGGVDSYIGYFHRLGLLSDWERERYLLDREAYVQYEDCIDPEWLSCMEGLYQDSILQVVSNSKSGYVVNSAKHLRDQSGSYYTSKRLARAMVEEPIASRIRRTDGANATGIPLILDMSVGCGSFLCESIRTLCEYGISGEDASGSVWGIDVDPIALRIAFSEVLCCSKVDATSPNAAIVASHFLLGNALLPFVAADSDSINQKTRDYAVGRLYSKESGVAGELLPSEGFDLIVGNPPWEKLRFEERKFLALTNPTVSKIDRKSKRSASIAISNSADLSLFEALKDDYRNIRMLIGVAELGQGVPIPRGELNTTSLFPRAALSLLNAGGTIALVLKSSLFTAAAGSGFLDYCRDAENIERIYFFGNERRIFPIDSRERFCLAYLGNERRGHIDLSFGNTSISPLGDLEVARVSWEELDAINPNTHTIPDLNSVTQFKDLVKAHTAMNVLGLEYPDCKFGRLVHLTMHAEHIHRVDEDPGVEVIGVLEGKLFERHDLRFATYSGIPLEEMYSPKAKARRIPDSRKDVAIVGYRYYIERSFWEKISRHYTDSLMLCWRDLTSVTNTHTVIATLSAFRPASQSVQFLQLENRKDLLILAGLFNSETFDSLVRMHLSGIDLTQSIIKQIPVPPKATYDSVVTYCGVEATIGSHIANRMASLYARDDTVISELGLTKPADLNGTDAAALLRELDDLYTIAYRRSGFEMGS